MTRRDGGATRRFAALALTAVAVVALGAGCRSGHSAQPATPGAVTGADADSIDKTLTGVQKDLDDARADPTALPTP